MVILAKYSANIRLADLSEKMSKSEKNMFIKVPLTIGLTFGFTNGWYACKPVCPFKIEWIWIIK